MPPVAVKHVISFTSQDPKHPAKDLVEGRGPWLSQQGDKSKRLQLDLQLEQATKISYIDIGNAGSMMVSVEVGRSAWPSDRPFMKLIPTVTFMTLAELNCGQNRSSVQMFKHGDMNEAARNEEWDRVRILCSQPFPSTKQYGLSLFKMYTDVKPEARLGSQLITPQKDHFLQVAPDKRNELISKMNLSNSRKSELPERVKSMEVSRLLDGGKEPSRVHHPNSPLSRAAQLVTLAAKIPTQQEAVAMKSVLEREGLRFLMSLNLSLSEMDSLPIKEIRVKFEEKRQKELNFAERKIFRDIAVDYARRRMEVLGKDSAAHLAARGIKTSEMPVKALQQKRKYDHSSMENKINKEVSNGCSPGPMGKLTKQENEFTRRTEKQQQENVTPSRKFTFGHSRNSEKLSHFDSQHPDESQTKSKHLSKNSVTPDKEKVTPMSRNALALLDSHVTTPKPKVTRKRKSPKSGSKQLTQTSLIGQWITPTNKKKAEEIKFQHSAGGLDYSDSSDDDCIIEDSSPSLKKFSGCSLKSPSSMSSTVGGTSKGNRLGAAPTNRYNTAVGEEEADSSSGSQQQWVQCPLCSESFPARAIEAHAASCNVTALSDSDESTPSPSNSPIRSTSPVPQPSCSSAAVSCPVCGVQMAASVIEAHAAECAASMFG